MFESETDNTSICIITVNQEVVDRVINLTVIFSKTGKLCILESTMLFQFGLGSF